MTEAIGLIATGAVAVLSLIAIAAYTGRGMTWMSNRMTRELAEKVEAATEMGATVATALRHNTACLQRMKVTSDTRWGEHSELHRDRREFGREQEAELRAVVQKLEVDMLRVKLQVEQAHPHE